MLQGPRLLALLSALPWEASQQSRPSSTRQRFLPQAFSPGEVSPAHYVTSLVWRLRAPGSKWGIQQRLSYNLPRTANLLEILKTDLLYCERLVVGLITPPLVGDGQKEVNRSKD